MSEMETSTFELESIAQEELRKRAREKAARAQAASLQKVQVEMEAEPAEEQEVVAPTPKPQAPAPAVKKHSPRKRVKRHVVVDKSTRELIRKHAAERKAMEKNMNEMTKKRERDIKDLMEKVLKNHYAQVDKERADYLSVLGDLKNSLEGQSREITTSCQQVVTSAAQDEVERMVNWFHDEFMQELNKKAQEYEELKVSSENQVNKMSEESEGKSQKIMILDARIKKLAFHLPKDVRKELFAELGLEHLETQLVQEKAQKKEGKGFFSKLSQMFKGKPKAKAKPPQGKVKPSKGLHKKASPQTVIAR
jgi:hypothetical protein